MRNSYRAFATTLDHLRETKDLWAPPLPAELPNLKKDPKISNFKNRAAPGKRKGDLIPTSFKKEPPHPLLPVCREAPLHPGGLISLISLISHISTGTRDAGECGNFGTCCGKSLHQAGKEHRRAL
jgi:hypothetical protein